MLVVRFRSLSLLGKDEIRNGRRSVLDARCLNQILILDVTQSEILGTSNCTGIKLLQFLVIPHKVA